MISRRDFLKLSGAGVLSLFTATRGKFTLRAQAQIPGGTLDPADVLKYQTPLLIPPVMPKAGTIKTRKGKNADYYEISMKQFTQQILPAGYPATTVWGYGAIARLQTGEPCWSTMRHRLPSKHRQADPFASNGSTTSRMPMGITCLISCQLTRPCTGRTRPAGQPPVIRVRTLRKRPTPIPAPCRSLRTCMAR
jgi:hypothetical protein